MNGGCVPIGWDCSVWRRRQVSFLTEGTKILPSATEKACNGLRAKRYRITRWFSVTAVLLTPKIPAVRDEFSARHRRAADFLDPSTEPLPSEIDAVADDAATGC